jgi:hypothetical protein
MQALPAYCSNCKLIFPSQGIGGGGGGTANFQGNKETCPRCGFLADVADGTFAFDDGIVRLIKGSAWTRQQIAMMERAYRDLAEKKEVTPGVLDVLEKVSPNLGTAANAVTGKYGKGVLAALTLMALLSRCNLNVDIDVNDMMKQYYEQQSVSGKSKK